MAPAKKLMAKLLSQNKVELTKEQKANAPWLAKVPPFNPHDSSTDAALRMKAVLECMCLLWKNPEMAMSCQQWLKDRTEKPMDVNEDETFSPEPLTVSNLPTEWVCSYLINMKVGWSERLLGRIKAYDKSQIHNLLCGYLNCSPQLKLGEHASDKQVVKHALDQRRRSIKPRFKMVASAETAAAAVHADGAINFGKIGIYTIAVDKNGLATQVTHMPSGEKADITSPGVDGRWFLHKNFSESKAVIKMDGSKTDKHTLQDYFLNKNGPHDEPMLVGASKVWEQIMTSAYQEVEHKKQVAKDGIVAKPSAELDRATKAICQQSAKRARERMQAKQEERSKRSRTSIATT